MTGAAHDYGRAGTIGIGTPQANPTVEAEMRVLLPPNVAMVVVRLTSAAADPLARLRHYFDRLDDTLAGYDSLTPHAFGFACTGSSYLLPDGEEERRTAELEQCYGYPVVTATAAIAWRLKALGARRIALASPYPPALADAATAFWERRGFIVTDVARVETGSADTRGIYALGSADALSAAQALRARGADAVLLSGTGMPSLPLIARATDGVPLLSSNLCLAARLCAAVGLSEPDPAAWHPRLWDAVAPPSEGTQDQ